MQLEQNSGIPNLKFETVEELLTARRIMAVYYSPSYTFDRLDAVTRDSISQGWQVMPHSFERNECKMIVEALQAFANPTETPASPIEDRDGAHARVMLEPYSDVMASILGLARVA